MIVLSADGVALMLDVAGPRLPRVLYWGACPGPQGDPAEPPPGPALDLVPAQGDDWFGRPALAGHRDGAWRPHRFTLAEPVKVDGSRVHARAADPGAGLELRAEIELTSHGVARMRYELVNTAVDPYTLDRLACLLPLPAQAGEVLDFAGRWARERVPQRAPLGQGVWSRESRRGRTGFDAGPLVAGTPGFGFRSGEVWAVHVAWSGNHVHYAERLPDGTTVLAGGELLEPGEIRLGQGETYRTPWVYFASSGTGLDGLSRRFHQMVRARDGHPRTARPVTMNTWEAVYFDHREDRLLALADAAAEAGAERFVVDDGWFRHRRSDNAGLGDWYVDEAVWPGGLHALVRRVREHGMQFGLWFEPEMANPDSDLVRAHPDWLLADPERLPFPQRDQHTLDLARPEVYAYLLERIGALVAEYGIDYIKWDHNRDLADPVHQGVPGTHAQTRAVYRLLDELRARFPGLEIESCSSGGARADLGILARTDRIWGSDNIDPFERQHIQRWTGLLLPYELIGSHVGSARAHISHRTTSIGFRAATALFGHAGIESDITAWPAEDRAALAEWITLYKELRPLLHTGEVVRADHPDPAAWVHGVVAADRSQAVFAYVQLATSVTERPAPIRPPGLDPDAEYTVQAIPGAVSGPAGHWPEWAARRPRLTGRALATVGLAAPRYADRPGTAFLFRLTRT
ncbi:alpha-galactosidase [Sphaerisporangium rufum]|uniref:Alpha-galactosidase n=2 Tax=Sphaerisporangium rufum TaxID=1381558 RepID=A0A919R143_9ACTN|nr:alpha-galactosidase [Sphaerisporangium rufum]GII77063.1 alpha-galactosidase [Sphaerisporangium rufum]